MSRIARPSGKNRVGLYEGGVRYGGIAVFRTCTVYVIFFHSSPSPVGCSFQGKLFSIFNLLSLVFVRYYLSSRTALENCVLFLLLHLDPPEKISSPIQDLFCSGKPSTYPGSASVQCGLNERTE